MSQGICVVPGDPRQQWQWDRRSCRASARAASPGQWVLGHEQHRCALRGLKTRDPQKRAKSPFLRRLSGSRAANPSEKRIASHLPTPC